MSPDELADRQETAQAPPGPAEPTLEQLQAELRHEKYKRSCVFSLRSTIFMLVTVAAAAVLIAVLLMPVLQIYGSSMAPTLSEGEIVLSVKGTDLETGDVVAGKTRDRPRGRMGGHLGGWHGVCEQRRCRRALPHGKGLR